MKGEDIRKTVRTLHESGRGKKEIARLLRIDVKTVRAILNTEPGEPTSRGDKILLDYDMLSSLYERCEGYVQRMHEVLGEEKKISIGYSTLTRLLREYGIGSTVVERDKRYPDLPGEEMQQDTSVYTVKLGEERRRLVCSGLYLRYSKMRYVKFYPRFDRFRMKCFFAEALGFFGYTAKRCIIDNTNLAVLYGTGERAVMNPEMIAFAQRYGFSWKAHRIRQSNRKAGKERNFLTLQTNFFPARSFRDLTDLNRQAFAWATQRFASRPQSRTRLIPAELFEQEKPYLVKLPVYIEPPYQEHQRTLDPYGYIAMYANYYWVPEKRLSGKLTVIEYAEHISIYHNHTKLIEHELAPWDTRGAKITPDGVPPPHQQPRSRKQGCAEEEKRLRQMGEVCNAYLDYLQSTECAVGQKPKLIRELYRLSTKMSGPLFLKTVQRALEYRLASAASIERIAGRLIKNQTPEAFEIPAANHYEHRSSYQDGRLSSEEDLGRYRDLMEEQDDG